jgi:hypothetical protein
MFASRTQSNSLSEPFHDGAMLATLAVTVSVNLIRRKYAKGDGKR